MPGGRQVLSQHCEHEDRAGSRVATGAVLYWGQVHKEMVQVCRIRTSLGEMKMGVIRNH